jgi:hypothetical protein
MDANKVTQLYSILFKVIQILVNVKTSKCSNVTNKLVVDVYLEFDFMQVFFSRTLDNKVEKCELRDLKDRSDG